MRKSQINSRTRVAQVAETWKPDEAKEDSRWRNLTEKNHGLSVLHCCGTDVCRRKTFSLQLKLEPNLLSGPLDLNRPSSNCQESPNLLCRSSNPCLPNDTLIGQMKLLTNRQEAIKVCHVYPTFWICSFLVSWYFLLTKGMGLWKPKIITQPLESDHFTCVC